MTGIVLAGIAGLLLGSFANVAVWRIPRKESVVAPRSRCPRCETELRWYENLPVASWVVLRARCSHCGEAISIRYPIVELLTAVLFVLAAVRLEAADLIAYLPLMWVLVVLSFIDLDHKLLPNRIVLPAIPAMAVLLAVAAAIGPGTSADWVRAMVSAAGAFTFFLVVALISPAGMGMGDVKLSALLGMALGYLGTWPTVFVGLFLGFVFGAVAGLALMAARKGGRKSQIPFGPSLALGTIVAILWGQALVGAWLGR